jgi:hypothetical protein
MGESLYGRANAASYRNRMRCYNLRFDYAILPAIMEAERINALSNLLSDLTTREAELRRYL